MRQKTRFIGLPVVFFLLASLSPAVQTDVGLELLSFPKDPEILAALKNIPLDYLMEKNGRITIVATASDIEALQIRGIPYRIEKKPGFSQRAVPTALLGGINGDFHTYSELERDIFALQDRFPNLVRIHDIGDTWEGRNIYALEITNNPDQEILRPRSLLIGCHHAREWISVEVPYLLAVHLCENYTEDERIRILLDSSEIWIIPLLNPDGLEYSIYFYRYWRKNRRHNADGSFGVDLNRNYGYKWGISDNGSSGNPNSGVYRGESAFSEPESRAVRDLFQLYRFEALVSYHNYTQIIIFPWGYTTQRPDDYDQMYELSERMSDLMLPVNGNYYTFGQASDGLYLTNGDTTDWAYGQFGIPAFTIELPPLDETTGGFFNAQEEILPIFRENLPAALHLMEWAVRNWPGLAAKTEKDGQDHARPGKSKSSKPNK
jgi:carboxypeptidase T